MAETQIQVKIEAIVDSLLTGVAGAKKALGELGAAGEGAGSRLNTLKKEMNGLGTLASGAVLISAARGIASFGLAAVKASANMEQAGIAFTTMLGSAAAAKDMLGELADFAARTPFDMPGVVDGARRLLAMGYSGQQVIPMMSAIGDAAAGLGLGAEGINRLTLAFGQMAAKGKVSHEEMTRQLAEAGIPAWEMLAKKIGVTVPQAMKMAEKGAIDAATGIQAVISGMNEKFGGMMDKQARTLTGLWSNIEDNITRTMVSIGDSIKKNLDLETKLASLLAFLEEFRKRVETGGVKAALQEMFPQELRSVIMGVAGAIGGAAVAAVAAFAVAMGGAIAAAAPFIAVGAALAVAAEYIWTNWDDLSRGWGVIWAEIVRLGAAGARNIINAVTRMVDIVADGWQRLMSVLGQSSDAAAGMKAWAKEWREIADEAQTAAEAEAAATNAAFREWLDRPKLPAEKAAAEKPDVDNLGLTFGSGMDAAATAAKGAADKIKREVDRITEGLLKLDEKTFDVANRFRQFRDDLNFQGTEGADRIYAEIDREKQARLAALTEFTDEKRGMFAQAEAEAAELQRRALSAGNAEAIARTAESLQTIKALREQAAQDAARAETEIDRQAKEKQLSEETWLAAAEAEIKKAMRDGDMESFYANLEAKKVLELGALDETRLAQMAALEEQRVVQQQYFDWEMESRTTMKEWTLGAMEEMKNGLSSAFADAITNGDKLGKSIANIGKQIANSFIQWQVSRAIAGAFGAAQDKKDAAKKIAALKSEAVVAWDLALAILIAHPGRGVTAVTEMGLTKTAGAGLNAIPAAANGAFVSAPTLMMVGEGRHPEGVFPLDGPIFDKFFAPLIGGGAAQVSATQNLYGDINTGSDEESLFEEWNYQLVNALRGA